MTILLLMRHAQAGDGVDDHARTLTSRGAADASAMGGFLAAAGQVPDAVLASSAARAAGTATLVADASGSRAEVVVSDRLYLCDVATLVAEVAEVAEVGARAAGAKRLLVVGHQPTCSAAVAHLVGGRVEFPTATVAAVDLFDDVSWTIAEGAGVLRWLLPPSRLPDRQG